MDKIYDHTKVEEKIYKMWEEGGYFTPEVHPDGEPYAIVLPPPNANGDLHFGHAMFVIEDILIRYHRMQGYAALWLPGTDHAGIETQFVFEKKLQEQGKSRFDYNREDLYKLIWEYVEKNRGGIENQLRRLGFSLDWSREKFTLDPDVVAIVKQTFRKMYADGLVYRDYRLVNYCTKDGTSFSDYEVLSEEREGVLYHIKYPIKEGGFITVATTRPETMYGDVAVMVHPDDFRYKEVIGKTILLPLTNREIPIIADEYVDKDFGTGAVKVTPSHDFNDFEVGRKHNLTFPPIIGWSGKFEKTGIVDGLYTKQARTVTIEKLKEQGLLIDEKPHKMVIKICYKCKTILEPLPLEQWYVKVKPLITKALEAIDNGVTQIYPSNFVQILKLWYANLRDWNISRQNVWGIQIPVWYEVENEADFAISFIDTNKNYHQGLLSELLKKFTFEEIIVGLQRVIARMDAKVIFEEQKEAGKRYLPETDTFDTWFSSGQWPYVTLKTTKEGDFEKFYPTALMETGYDILRAWVSRMLMLGLYVADTVPFKHVVLHGLVNDPLGKKMSKSKGNVVNPLQVADQYGADAVRFALVYGTGLGNDQAMSYPKLEAARKFTNKLWNMARFIEMNRPVASSMYQVVSIEEVKAQSNNETDKLWLIKIEDLADEITKYIGNYQFNLAAERLYEFTWHEFADKYIEDVKNRIDETSYVLLTTYYLLLLKLLHPFMPFVTEEIYSLLTKSEKPLMIEAWPKVKKR
ncbi:MAG TPA: valine--tRNA ligase [Candidatus Saccharimonadales bacterium]|nr:valine--tRNA ligase [Candidatus Saccharimonadales bacterium]